MITLHGIKNCDTVRKARRWLEQQNIAYSFRDLRETPPTVMEVQGWLQQCDWQVLLNKRSTTWKGLSKAQQTTIINADTAATLLAANPTLIKRPVLVDDNALTVGFKPEHYRTIFNRPA
jgi:arsenate reductase